MKCILSGVKLKGLLSFKTLVAKVLSLTFGLSSGTPPPPAFRSFSPRPYARSSPTHAKA